MANCKRCDVKLSFINVGDHCYDCGAIVAREVLEASSVAETQAADQEWIENEKRRAEKIAQNNIKTTRVDAIMLTTETAPNLNITKRIEIVTAECAFGMNMFKDLFAGVRNVVGGRSKAVQKTMRDSRRTALYELKREAFEVGANAVVGVDLDYVELSGAGSMVMLVASGTAVIIEEQLD
jgi:uncharacterized protein YbjQ (UPF0145 family)